MITNSCLIWLAVVSFITNISVAWIFCIQLIHSSKLFFTGFCAGYCEQTGTRPTSCHSFHVYQLLWLYLADEDRMQELLKSNCVFSTSDVERKGENRKQRKPMCRRVTFKPKFKKIQKAKKLGKSCHNIKACSAQSYSYVFNGGVINYVIMATW